MSVKHSSGQPQKKKYIYSGLKKNDIFQKPKNCQNGDLFYLWVCGLIASHNNAIYFYSIFAEIVHKFETEWYLSIWRWKRDLSDQSAVGKPLFMKMMKPAILILLDNMFIWEPRERCNFFCQLKNLRRKNCLEVCPNWFINY